MTASSVSRRNLWPLGTAAALLIFAAGLAALIVAAVSSNSDLVAKDYYEQEIRYQQQLDRMARGEQVDAAIELTHDPALGVVILRFPVGHTGQAAVGEVHFYRPSAAGMDRRIPLEVSAAGMQVLSAADLAPGLWEVKIQWTVKGEDYYVERRLVIPGPQA